MHTIQENIKQRRRALGMTQKELADRLDISDKTVSRWESGNQLPDALLFPDLAEALQTTVQALYGIENETNDCPKEKKPPIRFGMMTWYKILMSVGMIGVLLAAMELVKTDIIRAEISSNHEPRILFFAVLFGSCALLIGAETAYRIVTKQTGLNRGIYLRTDTVFSGLAEMELAAIFLLLFPVNLAVSFSFWYEAAALAVAAAAEILLLIQKRRLKRAGISFTNSITVVSAATLAVVIIGLTVVIIIMRIYISGQSTPYTVAQGLSSIIVSDARYYDLMNLEYKVNYYCFLIASVPTLAALILNHAENLLKSRAMTD